MALKVKTDGKLDYAIHFEFKYQIYEIECKYHGFINICQKQICVNFVVGSIHEIKYLLNKCK